MLLHICVAYLRIPAHLTFLCGFCLILISPKLRIWWGVSAFGVLGCLVMMFVVSWWSALIVFALVIAIYKYVLAAGHAPMRQHWRLRHQAKCRLDGPQY